MLSRVSLCGDALMYCVCCDFFFHKELLFFFCRLLSLWVWFVGCRMGPLRTWRVGCLLPGLLNSVTGV